MNFKLAAAAIDPQPAGKNSEGAAQLGTFRLARNQCDLDWSGLCLLRQGATGSSSRVNTLFIARSNAVELVLFAAGRTCQMLGGTAREEKN